MKARLLLFIPVALFLFALAVLWKGRGELIERAAAASVKVNFAELELRDKLFFRKGADTPFTGTVLERYPDGKTRAATEFLGGRPHGIRTVWFENGTVRMTAAYAYGTQDGKQEIFNEAGWLEEVSTFKKGRLVGWEKTKRFEEAVAALERERQKQHQTTWREEEQAQQHEATFIRLWDNLRAAKDKWKVMERFGFGRLLLGVETETAPLEWGIEAVTLRDGDRLVTAADWPAFLGEWQRRGLELVETEWHQESFQSSAGREPARSVFQFVIHAKKPGERFIVRGRLHVEWQAKPGDKNKLHRPVTIEARGVRVLRRKGKPAFEEILLLDPHADAQLTARDISAEPVLVYDLDHDGLAEIVLVGGNLVYWNEGGGKFRKDKLCEKPLPGVSSAVLADFNGDTQADLLVIQDFKGPALFTADAQGRFPSAPTRTRLSVDPLRSSIACTAGDIDGDGDLDVWVTQYQPPYLQGNFPTPYYDANDGWPSYLLLNDGRGEFTEATAERGLADKRHRRTWASSLVDLDDDGDLDLVVINDFAGLDVYHNDGKGFFTDVTETLGEDRHSFGMSHALADFDGDGRVDLYMTGMASTTARRLEKMGVGRKEFPEHQAKRMKLGYGNRMLLNTPGGLRQAPFNDIVARTGWSWGCTALDVDNDGDRDLFITNGNVSGKSAKDYCWNFWTTDIHPLKSPSASVRGVFYDQCLADMGKISWNGFEHNVLYLNRGGGAFENVAFLMGVSHEFDSRGAVQEDLDGDGKTDLVVVQQIRREKGGSRQMVHVLRNQWPGDNQWIGVRLREHGPGLSPIGATITVTTAEGRQVLPLVTGDSFCAQHSCSRVFGLGQARKVESIMVRWPNGRKSRLTNPAPGRYHELRP